MYYMFLWFLLSFAVIILFLLFKNKCVIENSADEDLCFIVCSEMRETMWSDSSYFPEHPVRVHFFKTFRGRLFERFFLEIETNYAHFCRRGAFDCFSRVEDCSHTYEGRFLQIKIGRDVFVPVFVGILMNLPGFEGIPTLLCFCTYIPRLVI